MEKKSEGKQNIIESLYAYSEGIKQHPLNEETNFELYMRRGEGNFLIRNYGKCIEDIQSAKKIKKETTLLMY